MIEMKGGKNKKKRDGLNDVSRAGFTGMFIYILKGHIVNWFWRDRILRRNIREKVHMEVLTRDFKQYIPFIKSLSSPIDKVTEVDKPEKTFVLWLQGEEKAPKIIQRCIQSIKENASGEMILLNGSNLFDYVELPDFLIKKWKDGDMIPAHFSDIVRIELLWNYGGYWMDASCLMTQDFPEEVKKADFFMLRADGKYNPYMFIQNCFIRAKVSDPLLGMWRSLVWEYWRNTDKPKYYFVVQKLFQMLVTYNEKARILFERMPKISMDPTHILWYEMGNLPYNQDLYDDICKVSFFQKCSYKPQRGNGVNEIIEGSLAQRFIFSETNKRLPKAEIFPPH